MHLFLPCLVVLAVTGWPAFARGQLPIPRVNDPRLEVIPFAQSPDIVHPIAAAFDRQGRLLVIESHTHFPPENYPGPKHDRIRLVQDTDGDGRADRFTTFFEGTTHTMDIAVHPSGDVYLATRNEILRLRDTQGKGQADFKERIAYLDTKGDYPHNGLSGLAFDLQGNLLFGMGENLGVGYRLTAADGSSHTDEGEGGNIFRCTADGKKLRRVATGFWNPFGVCVDSFGRTFCVDNDPDSMPPCRMLHVVSGGDYGYQFRYGRSGRHPFQCWNGQLPGTLPMMTGTGEAPCEVLAYESDGLPLEYFGKLLVTSWADHRLECHELVPRGASYGTEMRILVQGGNQFRPAGLTQAPDGSLFLTDWVKADYTLHGQGAIWQVRQKKTAPVRSQKADEALLSLDRSTREQAAARLVATDSGRAFLNKQCHASEVPQVRAACWTALLNANVPDLPLAEWAKSEKYPPLQARLVRALVARGRPARQYLGDEFHPLVGVEAIAALAASTDLPRLVALLDDNDPFVAHAARTQLSQHEHVLTELSTSPRNLNENQRRALLLCERSSGLPAFLKKLPAYLDDASEEIRFLAAKWIADQKVIACKPYLERALQRGDLNVRMSIALATALAGLNNEEVSESKLAERFIARLQEPGLTAAMQVQLLRMIPPTHPELKTPLLNRLLASSDPVLRREVVQTLALSDKPDREVVLDKLVTSAETPEPLKAIALGGLSGISKNHPRFLRLLDSESSLLKQESLRALTGTPLPAAEKERIEAIAAQDTIHSPLAARVLGRPQTSSRPNKNDLTAWLDRFGTGGEPDAGRRIFFHPQLAGCYRCHQIDGRGAVAGPDLSSIGREQPRRILESLLQPDATVAPHYQAWTLVTTDGKTHTGILIHTYLDEYTYLNAQGQPFKLKTNDISGRTASPHSIMPADLVDQLTDQELRDLLAFLFTRK